MTIMAIFRDCFPLSSLQREDTEWRFSEGSPHRPRHPNIKNNCVPTR